MSDFVALLVVALLVLIVAILSVIESAILSIGHARAEALEEEDVPGAELLADRLVDRARLLSPVLLLALSAQFSAAALVAVVAYRRWGGGWVVLAVGALVLIVAVAAELAPKVWAYRNIDSAAIGSVRAASVLNGFPPLRWLSTMLLGAARVFLGRARAQVAPVTSEEEIVALADAAVAAEVLDGSEGQFIHSVLEFGDTIVREAMVPRPDVLAASAKSTVDDAIDQMVDRGVSRMPVFGDDIDDVRGVVHIKDLFALSKRGRGSHFVSIAQRTPHFVPETKRAAELLAEIKSLPNTMVVVIDEYGGTSGIVTMEDLIEEIIGEIADEFDVAEEPLLEPLRLGEWRVHGRMPVDELNDMIGCELPDDDWDTVGGLIFGTLGHVPDGGEFIVESGYRLTVEQLEGRRITRVRVVADIGEEEAAE